MRLFIFGFGFAGAATARLLQARGWKVTGAARSPVIAPGVEPLAADDREAVRAAAEAADAVLIAAPPGDNGCPGLSMLSDIRRPWTGYLSTTGVYGDRQGRWVFEDSPLNPQSPEARLRADAEAAWLGEGSVVFRLPGIYGPGRSAFDRLRSGTARRLVRPGQVFSRIHVDDLAAGIAASLARPRPGGLYNLCDDEPAPAAEVTAYAAGLLGMEQPPEEPFDKAAVSPAALRFWSESKRVSNARAKAELGWRPAYPTYREGLTAVLAAGG